MSSSRLMSACALVALLVPPLVHAEPRTRVIVNGAAMPVYFNDGDSFRVLEGPLAGTKARLGGFNTLESHGAVHSWGGWTLKELYFNAKMATLHARRGVWTCVGDNQRDTYGRMLLDCRDLGLSLISRGLAHAMTVDEKPAHAEYLVAQHEAKRKGLGMWAHGTPDFILTSLHSYDEDPDRDWAYNRLVSTADGHSEQWKHRDVYAVCQKVCSKAVTVEPAVLERSAAALRADPDVSSIVSAYAAPQMEHLLRLWLKIASVASFVPEEHEDALRTALARLSAAGTLVAASESDESCVVHVPFQRRFGMAQAECLKQ